MRTRGTESDSGGRESSLRWGLLAASNIAGKFALDLRSRGVRVQAVASRDLERARRFSERFAVPRYHGAYEALLQDGSVDAVYVSLPNHLHAEWSVRAARAGKHVLCEKPGVLGEAECRDVLSAAEAAGVFYMEGFAYRCHPLWETVRALLERGRIGALRSLQASFCYDMGLNLGNIRQSRAAGGGALLDVGVYCLSFCRRIAGWMGGGEPVSVEAESRMGIESGVDEWTTARLSFPSGVTAAFRCAIRTPEPQLAVIAGETGRIEIPSPWHPRRENAELRLVTADGSVETFAAGDGLPLFAREALRVEACLARRQCPDMDWQDSLGQARALDRLRRAAMGA